MNNSAIAARLIEALEAAALEAGVSALVSVEITMLARGEVTRVETQLARKAKTLAFMNAECFSAADERIASAASVHKVIV